MKKLSFRSLFVVTKGALMLALSSCATLPVSRSAGRRHYCAALARAGLPVGSTAALREGLRRTSTNASAESGLNAPELPLLPITLYIYS